jgi:thiosulfate/3-mercaptopyruvate sulfurtransferase
MSAAARTEHLLDPATLLAARSGEHPPAVLDVRWHLTDPPGAGRERYREGHLPGARFLDLEAVLTRHSDDPRDGRHPLPDPHELAQHLAALGVGPGDEAVVYDEPGSFAADRAWWVLRWAGVRARVLDGGLTAWTDAGMPLERGDGPPPRDEAASSRSGAAVTTGERPTLDVDAAAALPAHGTLVDVRAAERFRGEVEPLDPRAGHIPGAVNAPAAALFAADGRLPDDDTIRGALRPALDGDGPVGVYCGSGVSATRALLALAVLEVDASLFPGSWSAWSNDPDRPVATGPAPTGDADAGSAQPGDTAVDNRRRDEPTAGD